MKTLLMKILFSFFFLLVCASGFSQAEFLDNLDSFDTGRWHKADGWTNGSPFNCWWTADSIGFSNSQLVMSINTRSGTPPFKAAEYRSNDVYRYGFYEARLKASPKSGTVTGLVLYTGPAHGTIWDEIDIEILGKNPYQMQCNFFADSEGGHEHIVNLGFDSSAGFHNYGWEWQPGFIKWYVDGKLVYSYTNAGGKFPVTPSMFLLTLWNGQGAESWMGTFDGITPVYAYADWIKYAKTNPYLSVTATPAPTPTPVPSPVLGDVNKDGILTIVDALMTAQYCVGLNPQGFTAGNADVNRDGQITIVDALMIAQFCVGLISHF